jgi:hypothetical protein
MNNSRQLLKSQLKVVMLAGNANSDPAGGATIIPGNRAILK